MIPTETSADPNKVIIYSSKSKLWLTGLGAIVFVAIGTWLLIAVAGQQFIVVIVKNPETYINQSSGIKRRLARSNYKMTGSPVNIAANGMQITFNQLKELIERSYMQYANRP